MNVALTRAKFGLIVLGRSGVLDPDEDWKAVMAFYDRNGLVTGEENLAAPRDEDQAGFTRLEKVLLAAEIYE
ncbi:uncharacterized protein BCR38DRAFT_452230 [Pseudomassariella vexata]|uniref:DNA2/NAM7 helicase-like C-terminal domain-containing protein n=1 Tax=Pseudomassariella vexata TaxID=1141098 RepID=A0A1Y2D8W8_9PEZI|nr:uncharacterized protein BCR38DRAFT_452230 [Pseudomassariella vexata]ORY55710.1 hypothetical protein BCR38DRAFT_452230 [Pseudomassariella vexata]